MPNTDIRVREASAFFSDERAREPLKFGSSVVDAVTLCHVRVEVENRRGQVAEGWGAIFLSHLWAFPGVDIDHHIKDTLMRRIAEGFCQRVMDYDEFAHPIDIFLALEDDLRSINMRLCREMALQQEMPFLGALVSASPVDAAIHDAYGNVNNISTYDGYSAEFMGSDLSRYLGMEFRGRYLSDFLRPDFAPTLPIFHVVGGLDKLRSSEPSADGRPNSLEAWIRQEGVFCLKVKQNGKNMAWDIDRLLDVYAVAAETSIQPTKIRMSLDANEQCESPAYMIELLNRVREKNPQAYDSIILIEQPTERDMCHSRFDMRELAAMKPVFVDESLTSLEDMDVALELGWSGIALKICKCHSMELLLAAKAAASNIPYAMQDLTCPGIALLHSVGLTARLNPVLGVETNARQYYPDTSAPEAAVHPGIFNVRKGIVSTATLGGRGLGYRISEIRRPLFAL